MSRPLEAAHAIAIPDVDADLAPYNGYCARACTAYWYLAKHEPRAQQLSKNPGMALKRLKEPRSAYGDSHYWLEDDEGQILDLIFVERKRLPPDIAYTNGKGVGFQRDRLHKDLPARKDTQRIIAVVHAALI